MTTRRALLGALGGGATAGIAGCAALPGFGDESGETDRPFTDWLYAPGVTRREHYPAMAVDPATIRSARGLIHPETYAAWTDPVTASNPPNVDLTRIDRHVRFDGGTVAATGPFSPTDLVNGLVEAGFTEGTGHEGFRVFVRSVSTDDGIQWEVVGAADGAFVATRRGTRFGATLPVEAAIDAAAGRNPRYATENPTFGLLTDHLERGTVVTVETFDDLAGPQMLDVDLPALSGVGHGLVVDGETTRRRVVLVYPEAAAVDESAVRSWASDATPVGGDAPTSEATLERDGRTLVLAWEQPLRSVRDPLAASVGGGLSRTGWVDG